MELQETAESHAFLSMLLGKKPTTARSQYSRLSNCFDPAAALAKVHQVRLFTNSTTSNAIIIYFVAKILRMPQDPAYEQTHFVLT